ncbi:delta(3,5)-Delta(2,4)-dienoyl-CoA isomerase, mitochondrial [Chelonus insularis]|uniref:delta(3,5)-Delta(2,4)-dienoyl-CoA isomerase, mitochondrial n=1 Tax=Chelonus insularis TaxID=460826 RepID=UPI00158E0EB6|nr:delta(3,5)-Delta(2,4)-dienoyl-CoA isomerase, mitochondrial [Chelonus insularis]
MFSTSRFVALLHKSLKGAPNMKALSSMASMKFETLAITNPKEFVYQVQLNRPEKYNALSNKAWEEIGKCFKELDDSPDCRVVILSGAGKGFCSGLDLKDAMKMAPALAEHEDVARKCRLIEKKIKIFQDALLSLEKCRKPVIAAIHGLCVGGGFNLICGADIRYCSSNAWFSLKEVDIGMAADVGALQWLPKIIGSESLVRELAFTARKLPAEEALQCGLVNRLFKDDEALFKGVLDLAEEISKKSPVAVQATKMTLIHGRDHSIQDGLDYVRTINQTMLQSEDFINATVAQATKSDPPVFSKL